MKSRLDRIVVGCNFIKELINQKKEGSSIFKTAATRLTSLLQDELAGKEETVVDMTDTQITDIFSPIGKVT